MACLEVVDVFNSKIRELRAVKGFIRELVPEKVELLREAHDKIVFWIGYVGVLKLNSSLSDVVNAHEESRLVLGRMKEGFK